jgi:hypothetical protein
MVGASNGWKNLLTSPTNLATGRNFLEDFNAVGDSPDDEAEAFDGAAGFPRQADD